MTLPPCRSRSRAHGEDRLALGCPDLGPNSSPVPHPCRVGRSQSPLGLRARRSLSDPQCPFWSSVRSCTVFSLPRTAFYFLAVAIFLGVLKLWPPRAASGFTWDLVGDPLLRLHVLNEQLPQRPSDLCPSGDAHALETLGGPLDLPTVYALALAPDPPGFEGGLGPFASEQLSMPFEQPPKSTGRELPMFP